MNLPDKKQNINSVSYIIKGQSMIDYVIFLTIIIATLLIMGYYIRNSLSAKHREAADEIGTGEVYVPHIEGATEPSNVTSGYITPEPNPDDSPYKMPWDD
jgi:hypothetical protein